MPKLHVRSQHGFTLVELMIVVALIGVLASIAIPSFMKYQARSRRTEAYVNLASIARAQKSFQAARGFFHDSALPWPDPDPYGGLGTGTMMWDGDSEAAFAELGWEPEGRVFYSYHSNTTNNCSCTLCFTATAYGDVNANDRPSAVMYVEPQRNSAGAIIGVCRSGMGAEFDFGTPTRRNSGSDIYNEVAVQRSLDEF
jgi:prepilin-type N-terminal cleavage/methylation domain-containing protein